MDIPLPEDPPAEESSIVHQIPIPDDANRYSPSLPIEDDPPELLKDITETSIPISSTNTMAGLHNANAPSVLGKSAAKKRLLAFTLTKQILPTIKKPRMDKSPSKETAFTTTTSTTTTTSSLKNPVMPKDTDQAGLKKKRKKGVTDKARDTISEIEEIKRKENVVRESMQLLYPRWVKRDVTGTAPSHLPLPDIEEDDPHKIESLVGKLLEKKAKQERSEKEKEAEKKERRERREKEKIVPKCWKEFTKAGFVAYHYRRLKYRREKLPKTSKSRHGRSRSEGDDVEDAEKKKYNLLDTPMVLRVPLTVVGLSDEYKEFPSWGVKYTNTKPKISYSFNPIIDHSLLISRKDILKNLTDDINEIISKFWECKAAQSVLRGGVVITERLCWKNVIFL